ncbi:helix-turn-helix domain-containing protein [Aestuariispira insulae]|uniref:Helix-turn-helix protein n=1 Tax=Aestuariispira insulae TaxID=1461337 RepID=A0A3D9HNC5_9PROT|nr:helix-turn-helix transcriptional regulator [Aestuariispira insulae]RED51002.1 helix-turn-helix protein [Aestuariispira insulae]
MLTRDRRETVRLFRNRLTEAMKAADMNKSALARVSGIDRSTLSQLLSTDNERLPRAETVASMAKSLQVSLDWLLGLSNEARLGAAILKDSIEISLTSDVPTDECLAVWHKEAVGYKIRYVPAGLPDLVKTQAVLQFEFQSFASKSPIQAITASEDKLEYSRLPDADMEICTSFQMLETFARGEGIWDGLDREVRLEQLDRIATVMDELYPKLRLFLYNGLTHHAAPYTVFGPKRAAIYMGQMYFVFNTREHIRTLIDHFDGLVKAATIQANEIPAFIEKLKRQI